MAMVKGVEKVVGCEGFNLNLLKEMVKKLNGAEVLEKPIKIVAVRKEVLVDAFLKGVESVPEGSELEKKIPPEAVKLYNEYVEVMEDRKIALEVGIIKSSPKTDSPKSEKQTMGKNLAFCMAIKEGGTRKEITDKAEKIYCDSRELSIVQGAPKMSAWVADGILLLERLELISQDENGKLTLIRG